MNLESQVKSGSVANSLKEGVSSRNLAPYRDDVLVCSVQERLLHAKSDGESFRIVSEFGSNAFRNLLAKAGIDTYGKFLDFDAEHLWALQGVGATRVEEFKLAQRLFSCGSRTVIAPSAEDHKVEAVVLRADEPVPEWRLLQLGARGIAVVKALCPDLSAGAIAALTRRSLSAMQNCGKKTVDAVIALVEACRDGSVWTPSGVPALHAWDFDSLSDMLLKTVGNSVPLNEKHETVMRMYLGLLDVTERFTLEATGIILNMTRERIRQLANKIMAALVTTPLQTGLAELKAWAEGFLEAKEVSDEEFVQAASDAFAWSALTAFSLKRVLGELGMSLVVNPKTGLVAWNKDGRYDWVETYRAPTITERRRTAIKAVLQEAGRAGLTMEEIVSACKVKFPGLDIGEGNVNGCNNQRNDLDGQGTRMIGFFRGRRGKGETRFSLNTFFQDEETLSLLRKAGDEIKAYMEQTGFGVVDVWKTWQKYQAEMPEGKELPKLGFYMMMRDIGAGGLCYKDYPRISYPGLDICENAYWWELYEYFHYCGHSTATFAQIMSFFVDCLGIEPGVAVGSTFQNMGLKKVDDASDAPYEIRRPPVPAVAPAVLLKTVKKDETLSLIKADGKYTIHSDYFDEDGRAVHHPTYVKLFLRMLEKSGYVFSVTELVQLKDAGWCRKTLKIARPFLKLAGTGGPEKNYGYWLEKFRFGDANYYVCSDWNQSNKSAFDAWAVAMAKQAGFEFTPYEIGVADGEM